MYVHRSNRMEVLVDELARVLRTPKLAPLAPETIVVQSAGMERWLSRELAVRLGAFAHASFPFPRGFIQDAMDVVLGKNEGAARYEREALTFTIATLLGELRNEKGFSAVSTYLVDDPDGLRRLQLAERIAYLFDQYAVYRPDLVLGWEAGKASDWQAILWRALVARQGRFHFAARAKDFEQKFEPLFVARGALPSRICIMGGASLPPLFMRLLGKVAEAVEVHLFALTPTPEYFAESRGSDAVLDVHPLLASLGTVGAALQQLLESELSYVDGATRFVAPGEGSVLHCLQSDLLSNRPVGAEGAEKRARPKGDESIALVSCHSPMREVEVLRDRLLARFEADPSLRPEDVVVMAPRIEDYAPFIDAVFEAEASDARHVPYRVADRSERRTNVAASALLSTLAVLRGRFKASEILDLLQAEPVRARFEIEASDLPRIHRWVHDSGIRWGVDGSHRAKYDLPNDDRNTWRFGLRRLLLGYALSDDGLTSFEGSVPHDDVSGEGATLLGNLSQLCETLFSFRERTFSRHTLAGWQTVLGQLIGAVMAEGESWQIRPLHEALYRMVEHAKAAGFEEEVSLEVVLHLLDSHFEAELSSTEFLSGGVTFCAMLPLRSIPFKVVYLLGMNEGEFPRVERHLDFDKMAEHPKLGDRSQRADDRYLFLETLLSAREHLTISYVGRGISDNQERPPAVVVSELATAIEAMLAPTVPGERAYLTAVEQPLQPFSPRNFDGKDARLFSFDTDHARGASAMLREKAAERPFIVGPIQARELPSVVDVDELVRFLQNPAKALLRGLGIVLEDETEVVEDREPLESEALDRYQVGTRLLRAGLDAMSDEERARTRSIIEETELGRGLLPIGAPGRVGLDAVVDTALEVGRAARRFTVLGRRPAQTFTIARGDAAGGELSGALERVYGTTQVECMYSQLAAKHDLASWVRHLAARAAGLPVEDSVLIGRGKEGVSVRRFVPLPGPRARELLFELFELYRAGRSVALPLFPNASRAFVEQLRKKAEHPDKEERALEAVRFEFENERGFGEGTKAYVKLAFRGRDPLSSSAMEGFGPASELGFATVSRRVFEPLLDHQEEVGS